MLKVWRTQSETDQELLSDGIIDMSTVDKSSFDIFMKNYKQDLDKLCVNPKTGIRTQNVFQTVPDDYEFAKIVASMCTIKYLYKPSADPEKYEIVAFAILSSKPGSSATVLEILCSTKDKTLRKNGKPLGIYLLDNVYSEYVTEKGNILKIQPATPELVPYYTKWKPPSLPIDWYNKSKTVGYLVYSTDIKKASDEQIYDLVTDLRSFSGLCQELKITTSDVLSIPNNEERKQFLSEKIDTSGHWAADQLRNWLSGIDYFSVDEIRAALNHTSGGGTKRLRKTRRIRRKKRFLKTSKKMIMV
jgi:hypothetical protein